MTNEPIYKDFIDAVAQDAEVSKGLLAELKYSNARMSEFLNMQRENLNHLEKRSERLDALFKRLCARNDK